MATEQALTVINGHEMAKPSPNASVLENYSREEINVLKNQVAPGVSDIELMYFLMVAQKRGLDPFSRQIYAIKRRQKEGDRYVEKMTIQSGIDGFRAIANRTKEYLPGSESWTYTNGGGVESATVTVRKFVKGAWHVFDATVFMSEFNGDNHMWRKMPRAMLAKCAEARALRKGWPEQLGGIYIPEEMDQADAAPTLTVEAQVEPVKPEAIDLRTRLHEAKIRLGADRFKELTNLNKNSTREEGEAALARCEAEIAKLDAEAAAADAALSEREPGEEG